MNFLNRKIINKLPINDANAGIGIIGGSFDPPHLGHQLLAMTALATKKLDQILIIPCAFHPIKTCLSKFEHRIAMCKLAFSHFRNVSISEIEEELPRPNYTFQTLELIHRIYPKKKIFLIIGSDLACNMNDWKKIDRIKQLATFLIFDRQNLYPQAKSRLIREQIRRQDLQHLDWRVSEYILENKMYF